MLTLDRSAQYFEEAKNIFPGGVNSPVRAFGSVGGHPLFFKKAQGAYLWDADGNKYIDYVGSWGPAVLGHNHSDVVEAASVAMKDAFSFGAPTYAETKLGLKIRQLMPSMEKMRFVSSGTEACMSVVRLARAYTKRNKILKFKGCYHGHADLFLVEAGSGVATLGIPGSPGVPDAVTADTMTCPYNDVEGLQSIFAKHGDEIAAIIVEPFVGNSGFIRASAEFAQAMREECDKSGALLIFDEVMTGFRVALGGAQEVLAIKPDLTTLGKIVGGGMPVGVYGGRAEIMSHVAPEGGVYQAGTLSGHPVAMATGLATLDILSRAGTFENLTENQQSLVSQLNKIAGESGIPFIADGEGGMFGFFFRQELPRHFDDAKDCDHERFKAFFHKCLQRGVYFAPSSFEAGFVSAAHGSEEISRTLEVCREVLSEL